MFETLATAGRALGSAAPALRPATSRCPHCGDVRLIAGPSMPVCRDCGATHVLADAANVRPG